MMQKQWEPGRKWTISGLIGSILLVAVIYIPVCFSYFQLDDWGRLQMAVFPTGSSWEFGSWFYRPVFIAAFRWLYQLFGTNAVPWHVVTVSFHLMSMALLYVLGRRIGFGGPAAVAGALFFGVYPANMDAVRWLSAFRGCWRGSSASLRPL